nr:zinc finger, GRF-type [Ipomoea batatas]
MSGGSQSFSCSPMEEIRCHCGLPALVKMSWSYANPGKRYRACQRYDWLDFDVTERVAHLIRGLLKRLDKHQNEIQKLEIQMEKKEVEVQHLTEEIWQVKQQPSHSY